MAAKYPEDTPNTDQIILNDVQKLLQKLNEYFNDLEPDNVLLPMDIKNTILIIKNFIDTPSKTEINRAQAHVANMIDIIGDNSPSDKNVLEQIQIHLDNIHDLLEEQNVLILQQQQTDIEKQMNDSIQMNFKKLKLSNPNQTILEIFPPTSTPLHIMRKNKPHSSGTIPKTFN